MADINTNKATVRRYYDEVLNQRRPELLDRIAVEDYLENDPFPGQGNGLADLKARVQLLFSALEPLHFRVEDLIAEDDKVVARWSQVATHSGNFMGIPPTGREYRINGIDIHRLVDGRMAEHWHVVDQFGMLQQLGVIPQPAAAPA